MLAASSDAESLQDIEVPHAKDPTYGDDFTSRGPVCFDML